MLCQKLGYYNKLCAQLSPNDPTMTVFTDLAPILHTHLDISHSTNSQLIDWIVLSHQEQADLAHRRPHYCRPHLLTADTQTGGRGQHGRSWQSPLGNVYLSLYLPTSQFALPDVVQLSQRLDGRLSLCVGYQLSQMAITQQINQQRAEHHLDPIGVKWVNDVGFYQGHTFQKLAGILIEPVTVAGQILGVVVGVGINISHAPILTSQTQEGLNYQAISLQDLAPSALVADTFYQPVQNAIVQAIQQFNGFALEHHVEQFLQDYAKADVLAGKALQVKLPMTDKPPIDGVAYGIDRNGSLQIRQNDGTILPVWTGTIHLQDLY